MIYNLTNKKVATIYPSLPTEISTCCNMPDLPILDSFSLLPHLPLFASTNETRNAFSHDSRGDIKFLLILYFVQSLNKFCTSQPFFIVQHTKCSLLFFFFFYLCKCVRVMDVTQSEFQPMKHTHNRVRHHRSNLNCMY